MIQVNPEKFGENPTEVFSSLDKTRISFSVASKVVSKVDLRSLPPSISREDLISEGVLAALKDIHSAEERGKKPKWDFLYKRVQNAVWSHVRKNQRGKEVEKISEQEPRGGSDFKDQKNIEAGETLLSRLLKSLPSQYREVMALRYGLNDQEAHSVKEISEIIQKPEHWVYRIIQESLRMMKEEEEEGERKEGTGEGTGEGTSTPTSEPLGETLRG